MNEKQVKEAVTTTVGDIVKHIELMDKTRRFQVRIFPKNAADLNAIAEKLKAAGLNAVVRRTTVWVVNKEQLARVDDLQKKSGQKAAEPAQPASKKEAVRETPAPKAPASAKDAKPKTGHPTISQMVERAFRSCRKAA